jgi:hypothetical protein
MRAAKKGSAGTGASGTAPDSIVGTVVAVKRETGAGIVGFSCAKQNIHVVARKTAERMILITLYLSYDWGAVDFRWSGQFQRSQEGSEL